MKDGLTQVKELKDKIHEQYIKIKELELELQQTNSQLANVSKRCIKAIEYMDRRDLEWGSEEHEKLLSILKGESNE